MDRAETKVEYIIRAKVLLRADLKAESWPEKVRAIERMNEASRKAKEGMRRTLEGRGNADCLR